VDRDLVEDIEGELETAGVLTRPDRVPAMCFLDLVGYTRLTEERGDRAAAELAEALGTLVDRSAREHGGMPVKWLDDGVMVYFREPAAVQAALAMVEGLPAAGLPPAHVGVAAGPVVAQGGDYFGRTVNLAALLVLSAVTAVPALFVLRARRQLAAGPTSAGTGPVPDWAGDLLATVREFTAWGPARAIVGPALDGAERHLLDGRAGARRHRSPPGSWRQAAAWPWPAPKPSARGSRSPAPAGPDPSS
jgi:class 3 adenylate cyclase